ncbi:MAG TPA: EAL domain-containing protein [Burkholderiaceae bacterium]|nr:EAL domain-containing protein [Burkholderiaceae bacterium]
MNFRLKTILGIAAIEAVLLCVLIGSNLDYLRTSNEEEILKRAHTTTKLFAASIENAILATDLASLESAVAAVLTHPGIVYARVHGADGVLAEGGDPQARARPFRSATRIEDAEDGVLQTRSEIAVQGMTYGRVELGLSIEAINVVLREARNKTISIAAIEMGLVALFSYFLGLYLTRGLDALREGTRQIAAGNFGYQVEVRGSDELAQAAGAFNDMSQALAALERRVDDRTRALELANDELRAENELRQRVERRLRVYAEVIRSTGESVVITDAQGRIIEVNPAYEGVVGRSREEVIGTALYGVDQDHVGDSTQRELWRCLRSNGNWTGEILDRRSNGESFPTWARINVIHGEDGATAHYVCVSRDITKLKHSEQQLKKLAFHDALTNLPNRALLNDRLDVALANAERHGDRLAVICLDLDRFKYVNDRLGHAAGDRLLVEVAQRISGCVRAADTVARMGGDEFTILLTHLRSEDDALAVAGRLIEEVGMPVQLGDETAYVGASVGISFYPDDGRNAQALLKNADLALYESKERGRGQYCAFDPPMRERGCERLLLSVQISDALKNDEFTLHYQPIVNLTTGLTESMEALIRWQRPGGVLIPPSKFIPHAEEAGLIKRIDCWVLERACHDAKRWLESNGCGARVCVNLSAMSVQQPIMAEVIEDILTRTQLPPAQLIIEITETAVIHDPHAARRILEEVAALGVGLALDDFGTGYSSLSYLTSFPIDSIKLDRSFVDRIGKDRISEEVIHGLLALANRLKLRVVAEGVERSEQQEFLSAVGCESMQGFHVARPLAGDQVQQWLATSRLEFSGESVTVSGAN